MAAVTVRKYFVVTLRGERGPLEKSEIKQLLRDGEIQRGDQVRTATGRGLGTVAEFLADDRARQTADLGALRLEPLPPPPAPARADEDEAGPHGGGPVPRRRISGRQPVRKAAAGPPWPWIVVGVGAAVIAIAAGVMMNGSAAPAPAPTTTEPTPEATPTATASETNSPHAESPTPVADSPATTSEPSLPLVAIGDPQTQPGTATAATDLSGWPTFDVGGGRSGSGPTLGKGGVWTMAGQGADVYDHRDQFRFAATRLAGDGSLTMRVDTFHGSSHRYDKVGVMFRLDTTPTSPLVEIDVAHGGQCEGIVRMADSAQASVYFKNEQAFPFPLWLRLERKDGQCTASFSTDGTTWVVRGSVTVPAMLHAVLAGVMVCSHIPNVTATATFDEVSLVAH